MGRDRYWVGGGGRDGGRSGSSNSKRRAYADVRNNKTTSSSSTRNNNSHGAGTSIASGCMTTLFHLFDFRFTLHHHQPSSFKPNIDFVTQDPKGLVAPRNSLESIDHTSLSIAYNEEENKSTSMGIQTKTNAGFTRSKLGSLTIDSSCSSSEMSNSPSTKTPNLVARLMGLDLLPDSNDHHHQSPPCLLKNYLHGPKPNTTGHRNSLDGKTAGTRSLPESPRVSSFRRSDFDQHRLSLQLNKENNFEEQSRSPRDYAREIVKQVKDRVSSRRFGMEITNTTKNTEQNPLRNHHDEIRKDSILSCSQGERILENKIKPNINDKTASPSISKTDRTPQPPKPPPNLAIFSEPRALRTSTKPRLQMLQENPQRKQQNELRPIKRYKKAEGEVRFCSTPTKPSQTSDILRYKQEETFVRPSARNKTKNDNSSDKKFNKIPLLNDRSKIYLPSSVPVKKRLSLPATKLRQKQTCLKVPEAREAERSSQSIYKTAKIATTTSATTASGGEWEYVAEILRRSGINDEDTQVSSTVWFSPSQLLDPSIPNQLEHFTFNITNPSDALDLRCNPKLLFDLVDEILVHNLEPLASAKETWLVKRRRACCGSQLIDALCTKARSYPRANCRVLEDIDALVAGALPAKDKAVEKEGEGIAAEIERDVFDALVVETAKHLHGNGIVSAWKLKGKTSSYSYGRSNEQNSTVS